MDKLQPLIRHHYWICFGFALIFTLTGWFLASGSLSEAIAARETAVKGSFTEAKSNADAPNARWVEAAKLKNEADGTSFKTASTQLRERQKSARQWPVKVAEKMKGINFQDQIKDQLTRELWASIYGSEIEEMLKIVRPFQIETGEGLVVVDSNRITHRPYNAWTTRPPESKEIWDAQEDIWLLRSLLNSINNVNGNAERITEAPVREIYRLTLRGGDRNATPAAPGAGAGGMGAMGGMGGMMETSGAASAGGGDGGLMGGGGGASIGSYPGKDFEGNAGSDILGEEFGADTSAAAGGGGGGMMGGMPGKGGMGSMGMSEMAAGMGAGGGDAGGGAGGAATEEKRYVDEVADSYKTRAFLLDVRVRDDKLPELLASLTDSDFPVEIVRVEIQTVSGSAAPVGGGAGGGFGGSDDLAGGGGMPPGMGAGMGMAPGMGMGAGMGMGQGAGMPMMGGAGMPGKGGPGGGMPGELGGGLSGAGGMTGGMAGGSGMQGFASSPSQRAQQMLAMAMSDQLLITVKIGGLMTLYQSAQEANAAEATEAASVEERATAAPVTTPSADPGTAAPDPNAPAPDPNAPAPDPNAPTPDPNAPTPDPNAPTPDPNAPAPDPNAPAPDPNAPATDPNAPAPDPNAPAPDPNAPAPDPNAPGAAAPGAN